MARRRFHILLGVLGAAVVALLVMSATSDDGGGDTAAPGAGARRTSALADPERAPTTTVAPTTTTIPLRQATPEEPLRILVAGDSLMGWFPTALEEALADQPVEIIDDWKGSSGLARPDFFDWPARLAEDAEAHDPDVVVVGFGGNDTQGLTVEDRVIHQGNPEWKVEYSRRVGQALDAIEGDGRTLWWIGLPLSDRDNLEARREEMTGAVLENLATRPWTRFVNAFELLAPDGTYQTHLPGPDGEQVRVRADDGIHPSPGGAKMIVAGFIDEIREERGIEAPAATPSTEAGP